jgi:hypothetical protein
LRSCIHVPTYQQDPGKNPKEFSSYSLGFFLILSLYRSGEQIMTAFPLLDCCQMLAIDPKTLRSWLRQAKMSLHTHPSDARVKSLTQEQVQHLAALHGRSLRPHAALSLATPVEIFPLGAPLASTQTETVRCIIPQQIEADLIEKVTLLERSVARMQEHLANLALQLLEERTLRYEQRLHTLEGLIEPMRGQQAPQQRREMREQPTRQDADPSQERRPRSAKQQAPSRVIPLIEYGANGTYIVICPELGELPLTPDSPEWFAWLATLSSFRFLGQQGRLSASRTRGRPCWMAYRRIHGHCYSYGLGNTKHLTIAHLEQMAATLQSHLPSL